MTKLIFTVWRYCFDVTLLFVIRRCDFTGCVFLKILVPFILICLIIYLVLLFKKCKFECLPPGCVPISISVFFAVPAEYVGSFTNGFSQNSCLWWNKTPAMQIRPAYRKKSLMLNIQTRQFNREWKILKVRSVLRSFAGFALTFNLVSAIRHWQVRPERHWSTTKESHCDRGALIFGKWVERRGACFVMGGEGRWEEEEVMAKERGRVGGVTDLSRCDSSESFHG